MAKVLVSLDGQLLAQLDSEARRRGMSRSALIAEMATKELGTATGPGANSKVHSAIQELQELFRTAKYDDSRDATAILREMRDSR